MDNTINYSDYRIVIKPSGSIGTSWQSDTIFGHLVWLIALQEGDKAVDEFLQPFYQNDPLFILSDGFPGECLPVPLLNNSEIRSGSISLEEYSQLKKVKKARFISGDGFQSARKEGVVKTGLIDDPFVSVETLHASLSRHTNTTTEGDGLFPTYESFLKDYETISVYVRCLTNWAEKVRDLFEQLSHIGYGRDKSTGIGAFKVESFETFSGFDDFEGANGFISLSSFVPAESDPVDGQWRIRVKRGFLGELAGNGNPFKRPLIQFEPGAVFKTGRTPNTWYGRMVTDIAPGMPEAVQNCMTITVPCSLPE